MALLFPLGKCQFFYLHLATTLMLISDLTIVVLAEHGVNQSDLGSPREKLEKAGIKVLVASKQFPEVKAWNLNDWGNRIKVDRKITDVAVENFQGLLIPGGRFHADRLRTDETAMALIKQFFASGKVIGSIGHGVQVLISAGIIGGRQVTASPSLRIDVSSAGAIWEDSDVAVDNGLVTCRCDENVEKFNEVFLQELRQGVSQRTETII